MIKLIASDMDGTLLDDNKKIHERNINAIKKAIEKGILFVPATGRTNSTVPEDIFKNFDVRYTLSSNGAAVYDRVENKFIYKNCMSNDIVIGLMDYLKEYDIITEVYAGGEGYFQENILDKLDSFEIPPAFKEMYTKLKRPVQDIHEIIKENPNNVEKINIPWLKDNVRPVLMENLKRDWGDKIYITSSLDTNIELCAKTANKGDGLKNLCRIIGIKPEEVIVFGDNFNDAEMLEFAGTAVAMENGAEGIKELADFITISNNNGGVGFGIEKFCF